MAATRLDVRMVELGLAESRSMAQRLIMAGQVRVDGQLRDKASFTVSEDAEVDVAELPKYVSRGGDKLSNAIDDLRGDIEQLGRSVEDARCIDIGASTGGFTDCLLQHGAQHVIGVDVGYGQLHPRLRNDERVTVMERTNARHLTMDMLPWRPSLLVCDASFIGLATVLPAPIECMQPDWWGLVLCKPQFEAGRSRIGKRGVIRDAAVREDVLAEVTAALGDLGARVVSSVEARPRGRKGNVEYVLLVTSRHEPDSPAT